MPESSTTDSHEVGIVAHAVSTTPGGRYMWSKSYRWGEPCVRCATAVPRAPLCGTVPCTAPKEHAWETVKEWDAMCPNTRRHFVFAPGDRRASAEELCETMPFGVQVNLRDASVRAACVVIEKELCGVGLTARVGTVDVWPAVLLHGGSVPYAVVLADDCWELVFVAPQSDSDRWSQYCPLPPYTAPVAEVVEALRDALRGEIAAPACPVGSAGCEPCES
ncbi:hypothetical protein [Streptomyces smyrnaeus]|uniref:hypothetical protein n=1 Tax=Streptomyces smyrnaeus TaxID=1387713 RepID=UPI00117FBD4E